MVPHRPRITAIALLAAVVGVFALSSIALAPAQPSDRAVLRLDIARDWRFKFDPDDVGLKQGWNKPGLDDNSWSRIDAGRAWQGQNFPDRAGYAWYRKAVVVPAGWRSRPVYLWLSGIDDEADVFVDGNLVGHFGDRATLNSLNQTQLSIDLSGKVRAGASTTIAVRVNNWFGDGGLTARPAALATSNLGLYSDEQLLKQEFDRDPKLPWPYWLAENRGIVKPQGAGWTMLGEEGSSAKSLLGLDGSIMASQDSAALTPWIYDPAANRLYTPPPAGPGVTDMRFEQEDGYLPVVTASWRPAGLDLTSTVFVAGAAAGNEGSLGDKMMYYRLSIQNTGLVARDVSLVLALRPFSVAGRLNKLYSIAGSDGTILTNGAVALVADRVPDAFGATALGDGEVGEYAMQGMVPPRSEARDARGLASAALAYQLKLSPGEQTALAFQLPTTPQSPAAFAAKATSDYGTAKEATSRRWRARLGQIALDLPDKRFSNAYYASLGYLFTARNGDLFLPGPLAHRRFWYRDAAYLTLALLNAGRADAVKPLLDKVVAGQLPSGEFPAILEVDGRPAQPLKHEWDAQGEGIFALTSYFRWSQDLDWLHGVYPAIRQAASFITALRRQGQQAALIGSPSYGILPPSESAEDLGPAEWHHYWDDFWALGGLQEAAFAARVLGEEGDAAWLLEEAAALRSALNASIAAVQRAKGIDYVPNGPEDTDSSAMARGTTPALWPLPSFPVDDPMLRRSFEVYFERWIAPNGGAFKHLGGKYWPYAGLGLGHVYLLLGMRDQVQSILDWTLSHETFPGLNAWAESVAPATNRFADGDMPHAWAAAEYTLLLRDMLAREEGEALVLASFLPDAWLEDGRHVGVSGMPTLFGRLSYRIESHAAAGYWDLAIGEDAPPGGYRWMLPKNVSVSRVEVDGRDWQDFDTAMVRVPGGTKQVRAFGLAAGASGG